jgi:hypothetical protein
MSGLPNLFIDDLQSLQSGQHIFINFHHFHNNQINKVMIIQDELDVMRNVFIFY